MANFSMSVPLATSMLESSIDSTPPLVTKNTWVRLVASKFAKTT